MFVSERGPTFTAPEKGRSIATIASSSEKIKIERIPVITVCAERLRVPRKNVNAIVKTAPPNRRVQITPGTVPSEAISLARCA